MDLHVAARQQAISTEMNNRMRINITNLIHNCINEGDIQTAAVIALLLRQRLDLDASFFARLISNYVRECRLHNHTREELMAAAYRYASSARLSSECGGHSESLRYP